MRTKSWNVAEGREGQMWAGRGREEQGGAGRGFLVFFNIWTLETWYIWNIGTLKLCIFGTYRWVYTLGP